MADEKAVLARARDYLRELSEGRDPLTGRVVDDEVLSQPRLRRCFAFVAAYLQRELARAADAEEVFVPTDEQAASICCEEDIPAAEFYERLNAAAVAAGKPPIPPRAINHFLMQSGFADGRSSATPQKSPRSSILRTFSTQWARVFTARERQRSRSAVRTDCTTSPIRRSPTASRQARTSLQAQ